MRRARVPVAILALVVAVAGGPGIPASGAALTALEFDEIDHVYTTEAVPQPGAFRQDAGLVSAQTAATAPTTEAPRKRSIFDALGSASTVLGNASSVVGSSGELGRALGIADGVARLAPLTTAMGMAGGRRFDTLLQTYVLPRVSPTGAVMLQGFLSAQADYKTHFGARSPGPQAAPPQLAPYAKGTIRHYTVAANGWVRIDDPSTKISLIIKPDQGKTYVIDGGSQSVHVTTTARASTASAAANGTSGTAAIDDRVEQLGQTTLDGIPTSGFRTRSTMSVVAGATGTCPDATIVSTRVEYFSGYTIGADAANASPLAHTPDASGCDPTSSVKHTGSTVPADRLLLYQANTVEKKTSASSDRYTVVIERGNLQERTAADASVFEIPAGFHQV